MVKEGSSKRRRKVRKNKRTEEEREAGEKQRIDNLGQEW
jgi:hypothetical protein